jgi:hypothetical protein
LGARLGFFSLLLEEHCHVRIRLVLRELPRVVRLQNRFLVSAERLDDLAQLSERLSQRAELVGIRGDAGRRQLGGDGFVARLYLL